MKKKLPLIIGMFAILLAIATVPVSAQSLKAPEFWTWEKAKIAFDHAKENNEKYCFGSWTSGLYLKDRWGEDIRIEVNLRKKTYSEVLQTDFAEKLKYYEFSTKTGKLTAYYLRFEDEYEMYEETFYYDEDKNVKCYVLSRELYDENQNVYKKTLDVLHNNEIIRYEIIKDLENHYLECVYDAKKHTYNVWGLFQDNDGTYIKTKGKYRTLIRGTEEYLRVSKLSRKEWEKLKGIKDWILTIFLS